MSIAMSVLIAPSRRLRFLLAGFGASLFAAACAVGLDASSRFAAGPAVAAALLFAALCVAHAALGRATVQRIDISGPGQLRLTVQQGVRRDESRALPVRLLPGSTLWPRLMLLRLETADDEARGAAAACGRRACRGGARHSVVILPDSLPPEAFRALAVALGAGSGAPGTATGQKIA
jgi:hypothetical protein